VDEAVMLAHTIPSIKIMKDSRAYCFGAKMSLRSNFSSLMRALGSVHSIEMLLLPEDSSQAGPVFYHLLSS
jgi:hypothetical protein